MPRISLKDILEQAGGELHLSPASGELSADDYLIADDNELLTDPALLAGLINWVRPGRIQTLGAEEIIHLSQLQPATLNDLLAQITRTETRILIISDGCTAPPELTERAAAEGIPILTTDRSNVDIVQMLHTSFSDLIRPSQVIHGVFMEVFGIGVLLTGASGIGKSELALELLSRNHRLIADDAPEFRRIDANTISGTCPPAIRDFIEVRGLGILNVRSMFGDSAIKRKKNLSLVVDLHDVDAGGEPPERVENHGLTRRILGVDIPLVVVPVAPGRNIAVIVETAARNRILLNKGYNAAEAFRRQQRNIMEGGKS